MCGFQGVEKSFTISWYKWHGDLKYFTAKSLGIERRWSFKSSQDTTLGEFYDDLMRWVELQRRSEIHEELYWEIGVEENWCTKPLWQLTRRNRLL